MELGLPEALVTIGNRLRPLPAVPVLPALQGVAGCGGKEPAQPNGSIAAASRRAASLSSI